MTPRTRRLVAFILLLAFGLSWLAALPLWLGDGLNSPWATLVSIAMMFTPAIAALVVVLFIERPASAARTLGLLPLKPVGRLIGYLALAIAVPVVLVLVALPIGAMLGVYPADFANFSAFARLLESQAAAAGGAELPIPVGVLVTIQLLTIPLGAFLNLIPALGEELGWRGWLRLRSESVWPAALAHGAFNAAGGSFLLFAMAGETIDTVHATILGWSGWIVPLIFVAVLVATKQFAPARQPVDATA